MGSEKRTGLNRGDCGGIGWRRATMLLGFCNIMVGLGSGDLELDRYPSAGLNAHV